MEYRDVGKEEALRILRECEHRTVDAESGRIQIFYEGSWRSIASTDFKDDVCVCLEFDNLNMETKKWEHVTPSFDDVVRRVIDSPDVRWWCDDKDSPFNVHMRIYDDRETIALIEAFSDG